jgi:hypothetical protein
MVPLVPGPDLIERLRHAVLDEPGELFGGNAPFPAGTGPEQAEMLGGDEFDVEPTEVMEPSPVALVARAGRALLTFLQQPRELLSLAFVATGEASGHAFQIRALNRTGRTAHITLPTGLILADDSATLPPLAATARNAQSRDGVGYCVEFAKLPPRAGSLFRVAAPALQQRYKPSANLLRAGRFVDPSRYAAQADPARYGQSIQQWALWTKLENWNQDAFTSKFVERTKKNIADMKGRWSGDVEKVVRASAVTRWSDITHLTSIGSMVERLQADLTRTRQ